MTGQAEFAYRKHEIDTVEVGLSPERFCGYVIAANGNREKALRLYERNASLSGALYGVVQAFEVLFRNALHRVLVPRYGPEWFRSSWLGGNEQERVAEAEKKLLRARKPATPAYMVSQLTFGFWTPLIGASYEKSLWVPCLHKSFPNATLQIPLSTGEIKTVMIARARISERVDEIKTLRNKLAHHEAVLNLATEKKYCQILEAIRWICPTTAAWVSQTSCFLQRFRTVVD